MPGWRFKTVSFLVLAVAACFPIQGRAQEVAGWGVRVFSAGGWMYHSRNIGKNAATIQGQAANQVVAELKGSATVGGGIEIVLPGPGIHVRANLRSTVGAAARGFLSICSQEGLSGTGAELCDGGGEVDARLLEGSVDIVFHQQASTRLLRPMLWLGAGLRSYDFETDLPPCEPISLDALEVCNRVREIFGDPSIDPLMSVGFGLTTRPAPVSAFVQLRGVMTAYSGGVGAADGERVMDVLMEGGVSVRIR